MIGTELEAEQHQTDSGAKGYPCCTES